MAFYSSVIIIGANIPAQKRQLNVMHNIILLPIDIILPLNAPSNSTAKMYPLFFFIIFNLISVLG